MVAVTLPDAAIVLVRARSMRAALLLTVSRPEPPHEMALPGGEVEPGESPREAAARELLEETGVEALGLRAVWIGRSPTDGRTVYVFQADRWRGVPTAREEGTRVAWLTPRQLVAQGELFGEANAKLFAEVQP